MHGQAHGLTYNRGHAEHCTCRRTECTPTHAHTRAIVAPLRRPMPNTVHIQVHVRCAHDRYTAQMAHAEHCASIRTRTSVRQVHRSARTCRTPHTHHRLGRTGRTPYRTYTRVKCGSHVPVLTLTTHPSPLSSTRPHSTAHQANDHAQTPHGHCTHAYRTRTHQQTRTPVHAYITAATLAQFRTKRAKLVTLVGQLQRSAQILLSALVAIGREVQITLDQWERLASKSSKLEGERKVVVDVVIEHDLAMTPNQPKLTADWFVHKMSATHTSAATASKKRALQELKDQRAGGWKNSYHSLPTWQQTAPTFLYSLTHHSSWGEGTAYSPPPPHAG